ncbi:MAG: 4-hydroxythreonine-4-phosphate dehydrogenase PdxA [Candidatus Omnitrophica bacterium]|nr:4-hydroxythreonine-4-phosphate dehydrogenase PdxA [Candidatus Omnitrophota bacterium]
MSLKRTPILKSSKIKVGITLGDPSGIGPAITLKAIQQVKNLAEIIVIGDSFVLQKAASLKFYARNFKLIDLQNVKQREFRFGQIRAQYGRAAMEYLDQALGLLKNREIDCLVTCPISKQAINLAGFPYSGHTEYLMKMSASLHVVMMLLNDKLRFSLLTRHIPLKDVSPILNKQEIISNIGIITNGLKILFGIRAPKLVVCGLNPHASDGGIIGKEEESLIKPILKGLRKKLKVLIDGPMSADAAIQKAYYNQYDCVIAMYHDQALIPLKLTSPQTGVNLTLGLPFVRTSPLHGTAFDIAGDYNRANPDSLISAIKLAIECTKNQRKD